MTYVNFTVTVITVPEKKKKLGGSTVIPPLTYGVHTFMVFSTKFHV